MWGHGLLKVCFDLLGAMHWHILLKEDINFMRILSNFFPKENYVWGMYLVTWGENWALTLLPYVLLHTFEFAPSITSSAIGFTDKIFQIVPCPCQPPTLLPVNTCIVPCVSSHIFCGNDNILRIKSEFFNSTSFLVLYFYTFFILHFHHWPPRLCSLSLWTFQLELAFA